MKRTPKKFPQIVATAAIVSFMSGIIGPSSFATTDPSSGTESVLQTVDVEVGGSGTIQAISDNQIVITRDKGVSVEVGHASKTYAPREQAQGLPVRILTSYRTEDSQGTDLADLVGYTGRISVNIAVQNLTVAPQELSYQVSGQERVRNGLVGAPLTVVSSVSLDIPAHSIITSDSYGNQTLTNGVVSIDADGQPTVQWAAVLAPPQLPSATTMRLVADVEDFEVPDFAISVQPGFVGDASVPSLLRRSFEDQSKSETKLISDTIQVLADVDASLAKTGTAIGETQVALSISASTIGAQTVADLQRSIVAIESSTASTISTLDSISSQLASSLNTTNTAVVSELANTVDTMRRLLGNTATPTPRLLSMIRGA